MRYPPTRSWRAVFALFLLHMPLVGTWASHARALPAGPAAHVEAATSESCPGAHDEARCMTCQAISLRIALMEAAPFRCPGLVTDDGWRQATERFQVGALTSPGCPRAPPLPIG
ncbi:MAG TPA: hypothetical protein VGA02_06640 [Gemmatimonadales bacterium]|jgi:hypothetical protein